MNGLINDCVTLCSYIYDALPPAEYWSVVNIAKTANRTFTYPSIKEIPTSYGYSYDRVPQELLAQGVIEALMPNRWFTRWGNAISGSYSANGKDFLTTIARDKGYLNFLKLPNDQTVAHFYYEWRNSRENWGPVEAGQYSVLINKQKLVEFTRWYSNTSPQFVLQTGDLYFLGQNLKFEGEVKRKTVDLMIKNINSIVPKEQFYELREDSSVTTYEQQKNRNRLTKVSDRLEDTYKQIQREIEKHPVLGVALIPIQKKGFGIFVNNSAILKPTSPQILPSNSPSSS